MHFGGGAAAGCLRAQPLGQVGVGVKDVEHPDVAEVGQALQRSRGDVRGQDQASASARRQQRLARRAIARAEAGAEQADGQQREEGERGGGGGGGGGARLAKRALRTRASAALRGALALRGG